MTHEDAGHYALKHKDKIIDPDICSQIEKSARDGIISCSSVHKVARELELSPGEVGIQVDLMELRLKECCLGLFGYEPSGKNFDESIEVSQVLKDELGKISTNGRTTCIQCWNLARDLKIKHIDIGSSCEKLGMKIKGCQLGAF